MIRTCITTAFYTLFFGLAANSIIAGFVQCGAAGSCPW